MFLQNVLAAMSRHLTDAPHPGIMVTTKGAGGPQMRTRLLGLCALIMLCLPSPVSAESDINGYYSGTRKEVLSYHDDFLASAKQPKNQYDTQLALNVALSVFSTVEVLDNLVNYFSIRTIVRLDTSMTGRAKTLITAFSENGIKENIKALERTMDNIDLNLNFAANQNIIISGNKLKDKIREIISRTENELEK
jgi:hypothetical protein